MTGAGPVHSRDPNARSKQHRIEMTRFVIIGGFILFLSFVALLTLDLRYKGNVVGSDTTVYIVNSTPHACYFTVAAGYNLVSFPCLTSATRIEVVTNSTPVFAVYQYVPDDVDRWRVFNPNLPSYVVNDLQYLSRKNGYVAVMNASINKTIDGVWVTITEIPLVRGWNLIGYPAFDTRNISDALSSINASFNRVVTYNKSGESFIEYTNPGGTLEYVTSGEGYWVNATAAASWMVTP